MAGSVFLRMRVVLEKCRAPLRLLGCLCLLGIGASAQATSPRQLKQDAILALQRISTSDRDLQKKISEAANDIAQSLSDKDTNFFLDDWRTLPPPKGGKVFDQEQTAADDLAGLLKHKDTPAGIRPVLQGVINALVQADRGIAELSVVTAERFVKAGQGDARASTRARQQFDQAIKETDSRIPASIFRTAPNVDPTRRGFVAIPSCLASQFDFQEVV